MIVYLHGFSSAVSSNKANLLKKALRPIRFCIPDYPSHRPSAAIKSIAHYIDKTLGKHYQGPLTLMGSSLGGYYAQYLGAKLNAVWKVILINPSLQPQRTLKPYIGRNINMVTGKPFLFSQQDFDELVQFDLAPADVKTSTLVLLDEGDAIIDYRVALTRYQKLGRVVIYPDGSHQFDHINQAVAEIGEFYNRSKQTPKLVDLRFPRPQ